MIKEASLGWASGATAEDYFGSSAGFIGFGTDVDKEPESLDEDEESTIKYNADPALKGKQTTLPDKLQKGIIDTSKKKSKNEARVKITKSQLKQIIKEEIKNIVEESDAAVTEFELYSDLLEITKQLDEFSSKLNVAMGLTATATKQSQLSDEVYETIRSAIFGLNDARIKMARAIGQDPAPDLAPVRER